MRIAKKLDHFISTLFLQIDGFVYTGQPFAARALGIFLGLGLLVACGAAPDNPSETKFSTLGLPTIAPTALVATPTLQPTLPPTNTPLPGSIDIPADHPGFSDTGLKVSSRLRLSRMTTLAMPLVKRRIGVLPLPLQADCQEVLERVIH